MGPGEYESIRLKNLEDNKRVLAAFGLMNPFKPAQCVVKKSNRWTPKAKPTKKRALPADDIFAAGSLLCGTRRKSARLDGKAAGEGMDFGSTFEELDEAEKKITRVPVDRPNFHGPIPGVEVGMEWETRMECSKDGIHRPTVAGIHGGQDGAFSIALSGGYEDDVDLGDCFTYTGEGGRDLKGTKAKPKNLRTAPQSKDQTLTRGNLALSRSVETKNPVRVIRGYKLRSQFAPEDGYRYDGIYTVEKFWFTTGLSGYGVWKFALKRCPDQAPSPWQFLQDCSSPGKQEDSALLQSDDHDIPKPDEQSSSHPKPGRPEEEQKFSAVETLVAEDAASSVPDGKSAAADVRTELCSLSPGVCAVSSSPAKQESETAELNNNQESARSETPVEATSSPKASQDLGKSESQSDDSQGSKEVSEKSTVSSGSEDKEGAKAED